MTSTPLSITAREALEERLLLAQELHRRANMPLSKYTPDNNPERNQLAFHQSQARYRLIFGGNQSGKSVANAYEIAAAALGRHRWRPQKSGPKEIYAISSEYRTLHRGLWRHLRPDATDHKGIGFLPKERIKRIGPLVPGPIQIPAFVEVYYGDRREGGDWPVSTITFISGEGGESARRKLQAAAIDLASIDEEIDSVMKEEILARLLSTNGEMIVSATLVRSEEWLLDMEDKFEAGDKRYFIVRLNSEKNEYLSEEARQDILGDFTDETRAVRVLGLSNRQFGLVYNKFDPEVNLYDPDKVTLDPTWPRFMALDPGYRVFAGLWAAQGPDHIYVYREMYLRECDLQEVANFIVGHEGSELKEVMPNFYRRILKEDSEDPMRLIDPAAARHMESGEPSILIQLAANYDIACIPATNAVDPGIQAVRRLLMPDKILKKSPLLISMACTNLLKERRQYKLTKDNSQPGMHARRDEPVRRNNHALDCLRYLSAYFLNIQPPKSQPFVRGKYGTSSLQERYEEELEELEALSKGKNCHPILGSEW